MTAAPGFTQPASTTPTRTVPATRANAGAPDTLWTADGRILRIEPGLADRQRRGRRHPAARIALAPVWLLELPLRLVNYPVEHWLVRKPPVGGGVLQILAGPLEFLGRYGLLVDYGGFGTGSGVGASLRYAPPLPVDALRLHVAGGGTHLGYDTWEGGARFGSEANHLLAYGRYRDRPREDFFGLGIRSDEADRTTFALRSLDTGVDGRWRPADGLALHAQAAYARIDAGRGRDPEHPTALERFPATVEGLAGRFELLDVGAELVWDRRDRPAYAHRGTFVRVGVLASEGVSGTENAWTKYTAELQQFLPLPGIRRTLALRLQATISDNRSARPIPVFRLETLGGGSSMRGRQDFRYRDKDLLVGNVEYRFPFWYIGHESGIAMDAVTFFDFGTVAPNLEDIRWRDLRSSAGFGFRMVTNRLTLFRIDVGFSDERVRLDFGLRGPI